MDPLQVKKTLHFTTIDSTNTWAKNHTSLWSKEGITLISADHQTQGRGRFNRSWIAPPLANITATFAWWMDPQRLDIGHLPQLLALSIAKLFAMKHLSSHIKWPNDVLLQSKKIAGILCETVMENDKKGIILGIGLNVNMSQEELSSIDRPATSLFVETGNYFHVPSLLNELQEIFVTDLNIFLKESFVPFFPFFQKLSFYEKGDPVRFHDNQKWIDATFEALLSDGSIALRLTSGKIAHFYAGEFDVSKNNWN